MVGVDRSMDSMYETKERRLRELEEQLARERELLANMKRAESESGSEDPIFPDSLGTNAIDPGDLIEDQMKLNPQEQHTIDDLDDNSERHVDGSNDYVGMENELDSDGIGIENGLNPVGVEMEHNGLELTSMKREISIDTEDDVQTGTDEVQQYQHEIEQFRSRGYNVSRMYGIFAMDIDSVRQEVLRYMGDVTALKEIQKELDMLDTTGFERDAHSLNSMLKDPDRIDEAQAFLEEFKVRIQSKDEIERISKIREIEHLFDEILGEFAEVSHAFDEEIMDIKAAIIDMETAPLSEYYTLKKMIYELKETMIRKKVDKEMEDKKGSLLEEVEEWERKGFMLTEIRHTVEVEFKTASRLFDTFLGKGERLLEIEGELNAMMIKGFDKEMDEIRKLLREHEKVFLVENKMDSLKRRIRLAGIQIKMDRLKTPPSASSDGGVMTCPKCGGTVPIPSQERPLKVHCTACNTEYHLKRVPTSESESKPKPSPQPSTKEEQPIEVQPIQGGSVKGAIPVSAQSVAHLCPQCGSELLQDSVFCGLCGYRLETG